MPRPSSTFVNGVGWVDDPARRPAEPRPAYHPLGLDLPAFEARHEDYARACLAEGGFVRPERLPDGRLVLVVPAGLPA